MEKTITITLKVNEEKRAVDAHIANPANVPAGAYPSIAAELTTLFFEKYMETVHCDCGNCPSRIAHLFAVMAGEQIGDAVEMQVLARQAKRHLKN